MPTVDIDTDEIRDLLRRQGDVIVQLIGGRKTVQELAAILEPSQRTIRRALETYASNGLVSQEINTYQLTHLGKQIATARCQYTRRETAVLDAADVLSHVPREASIGYDMLDGVESSSYPESMPDVAFNPIEESMKGADRVRGISPEARDRYVQVFSEHIIRGTEIELILENATIENLDTFYGAEWRDAISKPNCSVYPAETVPEFGVIIVNQSEVWIGVYRDGGEMMGTLYNDSGRAVAWAIDLFKDLRCRSDEALNP